MANIVSDEVEAYALIDGERYLIKEMETDFNYYNRTDRVTLTGVHEDLDHEPEMDMDFILTINGRTVFSGFVQRASAKENGAYEIKAFNAVYTLQTTRVTFSITEEPTLISTIVNDIASEAGVAVQFNGLVNYNSGSRPEGTALDYPVGLEVTNKPAAKVLQTLGRWADGIWWVDNIGRLNFGTPNVQLHQLEYITETSAGKTTPPYRGVKVTGDVSATEQGWERQHMCSLPAAKAKRAIYYIGDPPSWQIREDVTNTPVFSVNDRQIKTNQQAEAIAQNIITRFRSQVRGGHVTIVGDETIDTLDVIELPDVMGGERYHVGKVNHQLDNSNGYTVKINCEGLVPGFYYNVAGVGSSI